MAAESNLATQLIVALGGGTTLLAAVQAILSRRQSRVQVAAAEASTDLAEAQADGVTASASKTIAESAAMLLQPMQVQIADLLGQVTELHRQQQGSIRRAQRTDALLTAHAAWDRRIVDQLQAAGIPVEPPPPLHIDGDL